jgi:hypothetical protein
MLAHWRDQHAPLTLWPLAIGILEDREQDEMEERERDYQAKID